MFNQMWKCHSWSFDLVNLCCGPRLCETTWNLSRVLLGSHIPYHLRWICSFNLKGWSPSISRGYKLNHAKYGENGWTWMKMANKNRTHLHGKWMNVVWHQVWIVSKNRGTHPPSKMESWVLYSSSWLSRNNSWDLCLISLKTLRQALVQFSRPLPRKCASIRWYSTPGSYTLHLSFPFLFFFSFSSLRNLGVWTLQTRP